MKIFFPTPNPQASEIPQNKNWKIALAAVPFAGHAWSVWNVISIATETELSDAKAVNIAKVKTCQKYCLAGVIRNAIVIIGAEAALACRAVRRPSVAHMFAGGHLLAACSDVNNYARYQHIIVRIAAYSRRRERVLNKDFVKINKN
jgi:hypothetical protein